MAAISDLSQESLGVLDAARAMAVERGEPRIAPHLLLVALSEAGTAPVRQALARAGLGPDGARTWLEADIGRPRIRIPFDSQEPYSERFGAVLEMAKVEAGEHGSDEIRPQDLLLAVLREPYAARGVAGATLLARDMTYRAVQSALD